MRNAGRASETLGSQGRIGAEEIREVETHEN